jgi:hypothetical protein
VAGRKRVNDHGLVSETVAVKRVESETAWFHRENGRRRTGHRRCASVVWRAGSLGEEAGGSGNSPTPKTFFGIDFAFPVAFALDIAHLPFGQLCDQPNHEDAVRC